MGKWIKRSLIGGLLLFLLLNIGIITGSGGYYRNCVGINKADVLSYNDIVRQFGAPVDIEIEHTAPPYHIYTSHEHPQHGKMKFRFLTEHEEYLNEPSLWKLMTVTTYNPEHSFRGVHVGSCRDEVIEAYGKHKPGEGAPLGDHYFEGNWLDFKTVHFYYDEDDIVTSISFRQDM